MRHRSNNTRTIVLALFVVGLLTSACSKPTILESSSDTVSGESGISTESSISSPQPESISTIDWFQCPDEIENDCGWLEVPFDYDDPSIGSFNLFLTRKPAAEPANRLGSMLVNPGGPGFGGSSVATDAEWYFSQDLLDHFDIIGWDPRGTGESTPSIDCIDQYDEYFGIDSTPETETEKQAIIDSSQKFNDECFKKNGAILPYISTRSTAQDIDAIRKALGEEKITYFGFSYGSELGATWVTMFPKTVRAAVLDGASNPNSSSLEQGLAQAKGFETQLDIFLAKCSKRVSCAFHSHGNSEEALDQLLVDIDANPIIVSDDRTPITQGVIFTSLAQAMYSDTLWPQLERALSQASKGNGAGLLQLYDEYFQRKPDGSYGNELEAFIAISCLDDPGPVTIEGVDQQIPIFAKAAKRFGLSFAYGYSCALWPVEQAEKVTVTGIDAGPVVVIGTTGDAATPIESSRQAAKSLEQGILVTVDANQHTGYGVNLCVVSAVDDYLIDLVAPKPGIICK